LEIVERLGDVVDGRRGGEGLKRFFEGIGNTFERGVERASAERLAAALHDGTLDATRRQTLRPERFPKLVCDDVERLFDGFSAGAATKVPARVDEGQRGARDEEWELIDSACPLDWARAVDDVRSCQSTTGSAHYNRGLLNRFEDGAVRLLALRDDAGVTQARAALRLSVLDDGAAALLVDVLYRAPGLTRAADNLVAAFAEQRAAALGIAVVSADLGVGERASRSGVSVPGPIATDYFDLDDGIAKGTEVHRFVSRFAVTPAPTRRQNGAASSGN
jgi:hypothetical protein